MLKNYQQETLDVLSKYLYRCAIYKDVRKAYSESTLENFGQEGAYNNAGFTNIPYVCLRLPTGGGKTILAAHSIPIACKELLTRDFSLVIWLVPSNAILEQTYNCLQDNNHPYRQVLNEYFNGNVEILKVEDARSLSKGTLQSNTVIIISTFASWRVDRTEGRKVYDENGSLSFHFENIKAEQKEKLEKFKENNLVIPSLANVVYLYNPIFIIDEAHNARTELTFEVLKRLNPSCIIEFTATPKTKGNDRSNVLYSVSAADLKNEDMIKMPIELLTTEDWQTTVSDAIKKQQELEQISKEEENQSDEYIRPIVLIQAQHDSQTESTINVSEIKKFLLSTMQIPQEQVAIATGTERGIENKDLLSETEPIRFIITKQALKEGWDCPFAYIFCSVAKVSSSKDVEQLLGRVLRMPKVRRKNQAELNRAYAFVSSNSFYNTARNLQDSLIESGFTSVEASELIEVSQNQLTLGSFFGNVKIQLSSSLDVSKLSPEVKDKIVINDQEKTIILKEIITESEKEEIKSVTKSQSDKEIIEQTFRELKSYSNKGQSPFKQGKKFTVPQLLFEFEGAWRPFDEEFLILPDWNLAKCDSMLTAAEFPIRIDVGTKGLIDVDFKGDTTIHTPQIIQEELTTLIVSSTMDKDALIQWLVKECRHQSIPYSQTIVFISNSLDNLISSRYLSIEQLVYVRYRLRNAILTKIKNHFDAGKKQGFQTLLLSHSNKAIDKLSSFSIGQDFEFTNSYFPFTDYTGPFRFSKHYYDRIGELNDEEAECAFTIDINPNVEFWIRNLERQVFLSFWLQTSTDKFYPDFIVKLKDGTIVIVEYKGENIFDTPDSKEKRQIGDFYAATSKGKCRFRMLKGKDWAALAEILSV
ncbi:MAG: DEAD/DEAH box helicase family protein [Candidatus Zixiibacteriota bacterium]